MASIYRKRDRNGKLYPVWFYRYQDCTGKRIERKGWPDKTRTRDHASAVEAEARAIRNGEKEAPRSWVKLRNTPVSEIADSYLEWGSAQGGRGGRPWAGQSPQLKRTALEFWIGELGLSVLGDIELARVEKASRALLDTGLAPKSVALRLEALRGMCNYAVKRGYLQANPLAGLARLNVQPIVPHRTLTDFEVASLLDAAPPHRRLWYETGLATGFRLGELRALRCRDLDRFGPSLFLAADFSKDRKDHRQPITRTLADKLGPLTEGKGLSDRLLGIPRGPDPAAYINQDYRAGDVALEAPEGKASWHSLRKVFINNVVKSGSDLKTIQALARHSTAQLTMETYAHADPALLREAATKAENRIQEALSQAACHTGAIQAAGAVGGSIVSSVQTNDFQRLNMVGDTGFEPIQHSHFIVVSITTLYANPLVSARFPTHEAASPTTATRQTVDTSSRFVCHTGVTQNRLAPALSDVRRSIESSPDLPPDTRDRMLGLLAEAELTFPAQRPET